jgi:cyclase
VLFAGDLLFNGGTPMYLGSITGAIHVCENVLKPLGAKTVVPGHGDVTGPGVIDEILGYLRFVNDIARQGHQAGLTPLETAKQADLGQYAGWDAPSGSSATCTALTPS